MEPKDAKHTENIKLKSWLDSLQQESWQLELLISGFSIFLLIGGWGKIVELQTDLILLQQASQNFSALDAFYDISRIALACLLGTLIFHVLLRGMWIAAIGLRSVSGDIEYEELNLLPRFHNFLKRRIGSFDGYVERLERYCSVLFSVAFLIFFGLLSLALLSRPLYYNLIDNRFGRRLAVAIPMLMFVAVIASSYEHITHAYYPAPHLRPRPPEPSENNTNTVSSEPTARTYL